MGQTVSKNSSRVATVVSEEVVTVVRECSKGVYVVMRGLIKEAVWDCNNIYETIEGHFNEFHCSLLLMAVVFLTSWPSGGVGQAPSARDKINIP